MSHDTKGIAIVDNCAYVSDLNQGVSVIDITEIEHPHVIKTLENTRTAWGLTIAEDRLFVGSFDGIVVFDITDPINPVYISRLLESQETLRDK